MSELCMYTIAKSHDDVIDETLDFMDDKCEDIFDHTQWSLDLAMIIHKFYSLANDIKT